MVHTPRRRNRGRPRILYWFRTPPGIRVGRAALDEEAIRLIEEHHPQIHFDWPQILNGEEEPVPPEPARRAERAAPPAAAPTAEAESAPLPPPVPDEPVSPAHARLGSEGLARLRARFADVSATISRRVQEEARRQQLHELAERLNPDTWVTAEEVQRGLDEYENVLASLREVVGRRRRRKRSRSAAAVTSAGNPAGEAVSSEEDEDESEGSEPA